jgi:N-acetylneuraminic acid mutarotase
MFRVLVTLTILMAVAAVGVQGQWNPATPLPDARWYPGCCALNGFVYVTGGEQGMAHSNVWFAQVQEDGFLTPWTSTTPLPSGRMYHGCVAYNDHIYALGGWGSGGYRTTVWYARIEEDGSIPAWSTTTSLPTATGAIGCVVHDRYIYVIGGYNGSTDFTTVWFAPILEDGSVGTWDTTTPMPAVRRCHGACAHNGYLYITGGFTWEYLPVAHNDVWFAEVQEDGSIAPWVATTSLLEAQYGHPCSAYDDRLLITGGQTAYNYLSTTRQGHVQGDGSIDPWSQWDNLPETRTGHGSCTCKGFLYVLGGTNGGGNLSSVRYIRVAPPADVPTDPFAAQHSGVWLTAGPTVVGHNIEIEYRMAPAYGNDTMPISLGLYDIAGRLVHSLFNARLERGNNRICWTVPRSGVYLLRLSTPFATETHRIVAVQ